MYVQRLLRTNHWSDDLKKKENDEGKRAKCGRKKIEFGRQALFS